MYLNLGMILNRILIDYLKYLLVFFLLVVVTVNLTSAQNTGEIILNESFRERPLQEFFDTNGFMAGERYFEKLYDSKGKLLAFHSVDKIKTEAYNDKEGRLKDTKLKQYTSYYFYSVDTGFKRMQPRRSSFLNLFPEKKKEIRRILRKNSLFRISETEMVQVFNLLEAEGFF